MQPIDSNGSNGVRPGSAEREPAARCRRARSTASTGRFPGPRINAEYGTAALVRFENHLDEDNGYDRQDFGAPELLVHHPPAQRPHGPESDGNPRYALPPLQPARPRHARGGLRAGEWVDNLYLGYPAGGDDREKQSFFWFHDHVHGHTGANVYKGMVGLMPIYDPSMDNGDETT